MRSSFSEVDEIGSAHQSGTSNRAYSTSIVYTSRCLQVCMVIIGDSVELPRRFNFGHAQLNGREFRGFLTFVRAKRSPRPESVLLSAKRSQSPESVLKCKKVAMPRKCIFKCKISQPPESVLLNAKRSPCPESVLKCKKVTTPTPPESLLWQPNSCYYLQTG